MLGTLLERCMGGVLCLLAEADDRENFVGAYKEYTGKVYEDIDF